MSTTSQSPMQEAHLQAAHLRAEGERKSNDGRDAV